MHYWRLHGHLLSWPVPLTSPLQPPYLRQPGCTTLTQPWQPRVGASLLSGLMLTGFAPGAKMPTQCPSLEPLLLLHTYRPLSSLIRPFMLQPSSWFPFWILAALPQPWRSATGPKLSGQHIKSHNNAFRTAARLPSSLRKTTFRRLRTPPAYLWHHPGRFGPYPPPGPGEPQAHFSAPAAPRGAF
jgi:hypothetical protein